MRRNPFYLSLRATEILRKKFREEVLGDYSHHNRPYLTKLRDEDRHPKIFQGRPERPNYAWIMYHAGELASRLGYDSVSVLEFGVAGGNGLKGMEEISIEISAIHGIEIEVYGFDVGSGFPQYDDWRDQQFHYVPGDYKSDLDGVRDRLDHAELIEGRVENTTDVFFDEYDPAPVAAAGFDVDMYSSTRAALEVFERSDSSRTLPRAFLYFDEAVNPWTNPQVGISEHVGIYAAVEEFNATHEARKIGRLEFAMDEYLLTHLQLEKMFMYYDSEHPAYTDPWDKPASEGPERESK